MIISGFECGLGVEDRGREPGLVPCTQCVYVVSSDNCSIQVLLGPFYRGEEYGFEQLCN